MNSALKFKGRNKITSLRIFSTRHNHKISTLFLLLRVRRSPVDHKIKHFACERLFCVSSRSVVDDFDWLRKISQKSKMIYFMVFLPDCRPHGSTMMVPNMTANVITIQTRYDCKIDQTTYDCTHLLYGSNMTSNFFNFGIIICVGEKFLHFRWNSNTLFR